MTNEERAYEELRNWIDEAFHIVDGGQYSKSELIAELMNALDIGIEELE